MYWAGDDPDPYGYAPEERFDEEPPCEECGGWHRRRICERCREIECTNCRCEQSDDEDGPIS